MNLSCLHSLLASEAAISFRVFLIESSKNWSQNRYPYNVTNLKVIVPESGFNYNRFLNIGLSFCKTDLIVFSNNDVIFHPGWFSEILTARQKHPSLQSLCPFDQTSPYLRYDNFNKKEVHFGYRVPIEFVGWCFVVERNIFMTTGPFDENFDLYFQDNDFAKTLKYHNIPHGMVPASFVKHVGGFTTGVIDASTKEKYKQDLLKLNKKWGTPITQNLVNAIKSIRSRINLVFRNRNH